MTDCAALSTAPLAASATTPATMRAVAPVRFRCEFPHAAVFERCVEVMMQSAQSRDATLTISVSRDAFVFSTASFADNRLFFITLDARSAFETFELAEAPLDIQVSLDQLRLFVLNSKYFNSVPIEFCVADGLELSRSFSNGVRHRFRVPWKRGEKEVVKLAEVAGALPSLRLTNELLLSVLSQSLKGYKKSELDAVRLRIEPGASQAGSFHLEVESSGYRSQLTLRSFHQSGDFLRVDSSAAHECLLPARKLRLIASLLRFLGNEVTLTFFADALHLRANLQ